MSLIEKASKIVTAARDEALARNNALVGELKELLIRNESPKPGDEVRVAKIIQELDIPAERLPEAFSIAQKLAEYDELDAKGEDIRAASHSAQQKLSAIDEWWKSETDRLGKEYSEKRAAAEIEVSRASGPEYSLTQSRQSISKVRLEWLALTSGITMEEARKRMHM